MVQLTPSLAALLEPPCPCFRPEVFAAWVVCLGRRTLSWLWETTGRAAAEDHSRAFRLFNQAAWNWGEVSWGISFHRDGLAPGCAEPVGPRPGLLAAMGRCGSASP